MYDCRYDTPSFLVFSQLAVPAELETTAFPYDYQVSRLSLRTPVDDSDVTVVDTLVAPAVTGDSEQIGTGGMPYE